MNYLFYWVRAARDALPEWPHADPGLLDWEPQGLLPPAFSTNVPALPPANAPAQEDDEDSEDGFPVLKEVKKEKE
jgi:hypothetical protein